MWCKKLEYSAGLVIGFCTVIKMPLLLFLSYLLVRRRWRFTAGMATTLLVAVVLSHAVFGFALTRGWYGQCVQPVSMGLSRRTTCRRWMR